MKPLTFALCVTTALALGFPFASSKPQEPAATGPAWEYEVVGITDIHGSTIGNLKDAITSGDGIIGKAKATDEELAQSIEDVLDDYGKDGWELVTATKAQLIFKRPSR